MRGGAGRRLILVAVVFVSLSSGCGSPSESSLDVVGREVFARSAEVTSAIKSARFEYEKTQSGGDFATRTSGSIDLIAHRVAATTTFKISGEPSEPMSAETAAAFGEPTEYVLADDTLYLRGGFGVGLWPEPADVKTRLQQWLMIDLRRLQLAPDVDFDSIVTQPEQLWKRIAAVAREPERVGEEKIRGVTTTQWRATLSPTEMVDLAKTSGVETGEMNLTELGSMADERLLIIDVWVDKAGRIRKERESFDVDAAINAWRRDHPVSSTSTMPSLRGRDLPELSRLLADPRFSSDIAETLLRDQLDVTMTWELYDLDEPIQIELPENARDVTDHVVKEAEKKRAN